ncbi:MFS transporter [Nocardioidaceae bacterium]|nr:MFS transporter [Nocardioidaceae bacterium]
MASRERRSLWRHRDFRLLWAGDVVSVFGFSLVSLAIPLLALRLLDADAFEMGLLTALENLAFLLIGLPAGALVDRWVKRRVLILGDLTRGAMLLSIPLAWWAGVLTLPQVYVVVFLVGCVTVFFDVANQSYLPELVPADAIGEGNAKLQATQQVAQVGGPSVAAVLVRLLGSPVTIAATSVCMAASALFVSRIATEDHRPTRTEGSRLRTEVAEGLRFVVRHPLLVRITACTGLSNFAGALTAGLFVLYAVRTLGLAETTLGLVLSVSAAGGLLGAVTSDRFARLVGEGRAIPLAAVGFALLGLHVPLAAYVSPVPLLMTGGFLTSYAIVVYNVVQVSFRQRVCPPALLGRMNASIRFLVWGPMPVGALLGGVLGSQVGVLAALWIGAALNVLGALPVLLSPLVRMRDLPHELERTR